MDITTIRWQNLERLATKHRYEKDFCSSIGMHPSYFSQLKSGGKTLGNRRAREIEATLGLQRGWLDTPHATAPERAPSDTRQADGGDALLAAIRCLSPEVGAAMTEELLRRAQTPIK